MSETQRKVAGVTVIETAASSATAGWQLVYAPGAGSNVNDPFGTFASRTLAERGVRCARFQFPYQEAGSRRPDRGPVLQQTWRSVLDAVRDPSLQCVISGRSMGGRMATMIVADGTRVDGLVAFAYPLHQPKRPETARTEHLSRIHVPTLFCSGTRDTFGTPEELVEAAALVKGSRLHLLDGADHGFAVLKRSGRAREDIYAEAVNALEAWVADEVLRA